MQPKNPPSCRRRCIQGGETKAPLYEGGRRSSREGGGELTCGPGTDCSTRNGRGQSNVEVCLARLKKETMVLLENYETQKPIAIKCESIRPVKNKNSGKNQKAEYVERSNSLKKGGRERLAERKTWDGWSQEGGRGQPGALPAGPG